MPTEWTTHADGVHTAIRTDHDLDGSLSSVRIQLDSFRVREWEPVEETEGERPRDINGEKIPESAHFVSEEGVYHEHADGCHATLRFDVNGEGVAELSSIEPEDGDRLNPRHMQILPAAERLVANLDGVEDFVPTIDTLATGYHNASDVVIERLDT